MNQRQINHIAFVTSILAKCFSYLETVEQTKEVEELKKLILEALSN